ncbi:MAG: SGNH/GDSL hydrolase family protein [Candidatus Methylumidiphilus sp.]
MDKRASRLPSWAMWAMMVVLMVLTIHVVIEGAVQLYFANQSGAWKYLSEFREKARQAGLSLSQYGQKVGLDPYLGWGREEARQHEPPPTVAKSGTVLFVGDSVTAGHDVRAGEEDYPSLLAAQWGKRGVKVVNLAARGYGVDQMWLKLLLQAGGYHPDAIVFAYIPHDLIRPGNDFNFGLPKPRFRFPGPHSTLTLAEEIGEYHRHYDAARSGFHLSGWFAGHYWDNKEYYAPALATDYFDRLYRHIGEGLAQISQEWKIPVIVVKLTNFRQFSGSAPLIRLAASGLVNPEHLDKADVRYLDMDNCVLAKAKARGLELEKEFAHHPSPLGHRLLAECLGDFMEPIVLNRLNGSTVKGSPKPAEN